MSRAGITIHREGHPAKIKLWYNGPKLVEVVTEGSRAIKRRYQPSADGSKLDVELMPVVPPGKSETITLVRRKEKARAEK